MILIKREKDRLLGEIMEPNGQDFSSNIERKQLEFGFSLSISWVGGPFAIPISISPNSHLDFSEARLCNFPCNFSTLCPNDSKSPPSRKACTNPIEQEGEIEKEVSKIERAPINIRTFVAGTPFVQKVISSELVDQKSNTTTTNTEAHTKEKQSFMVSEKWAILVETPAVLVGCVASVGGREAN